MKERKPKQTKETVPIRRIMVIVVLMVACGCAVKGYIGNYYEATEIAHEALRGTGNVTVTQTDDYYLFQSANTPKVQEDEKGIIFYPGGKVEETAYAPLMAELAECGYEVYLMRMPARLAVLKPNAADPVIEEREDIRQWTLMGHSLGGAMAADYAAEHNDCVSELVLLAAYSTVDLSECGITVLSIYGSEDGVLNREKYEKNRANLPENAMEYVIDGGNHSGFGYYGQQKGDHVAGISPKEQQEAVVDALCYDQ